MNRDIRSIALVSREYPPFFGGGIGTYARWIVPALTRAGVRVHVITEAHDKTHPRCSRDGLVTVHRVPMAVGRGGWTTAAARFSIAAGRKAEELFRHGAIDVCEFAECEAAGAALTMMRDAGGAARVPTLVHLHTPSEQLFVLRSLTPKAVDANLAFYFTAERMALRLADRVCAPSRFIADFAHAHYGLSERPAVIPYAAAPLPRVEPGKPNAREQAVFYAGRIEPRKGVEPLIEAWHTIHAQHPGATLRLAGADTGGAPDGGSMKAYLRERLGPASGSVSFLGKLPADALAREYARCAVSVIPSLWENFPNVCIESMAHGCAVLVSDRGGMGEMIEGTTAGERFRAGDANDLASKLAAMLAEDHARLVARGSTARDRIAWLCDPQRVAAERRDLYREVADSQTTANASPPAPAHRAGAITGDWRTLEAALSGDLSGLGLPAPEPAVERWVVQRDPTVQPRQTERNGATQCAAS
ncbi:MAG: glycosyltransferase family 4 protein [Planctomycetota bacterium]